MRNSQIIRLASAEYGKVRALFAGLEYNVSLDSTLDGSTPGTVWADDPQNPHAALIHSVECWALGGNPERLDAWTQFVQEDLFSTDEGEELDLRVTAAWENQMERLATKIGRETIAWSRRHYVCHRLVLADWAQRLPTGFTIRYMNVDLLNSIEEGNVKAPAHLLHWIVNNWGNQETFLSLGFGACTIDEATREIVSWSVADCVSGNRCEIGIHTHPDYRRRGLASLTAAAAVDYAFGHSYSEVGWHCAEENEGSIGTAEKVGFTLERKYTARIYLSDAGSHCSVQAYRALLDGNFQASIAAYDKAFMLRDDYPYWTYFYAARAYAGLGNTSAALQALFRAANLGETRMELLDTTTEFISLRNHEAWAGIAHRIRENNQKSER